MEKEVWNTIADFQGKIIGSGNRAAAIIVEEGYVLFGSKRKHVLDFH
ncbi:MAG: hypothetical protein ACOX4A_07975 [Saccharofermentanales bacterium]